MPDSPGQHTDLAHHELFRHKWLAMCAGLQDEPYLLAGTGVYAVPVDASGNVLMIREPAITDAQPVWSLPAGGVDGEDPALAVNRELQEEIGYKAARLDYLGKLDPLHRHAIWPNYIYLARELIPSRLPGDEDFTITVAPVPLHDFESLMESGELSGAVVIAALYMARRFLERE